jgi:acetyl-CoA acetyltransferase
MSNPSIVIASAARTAVGSFNGAFGNTPAHELGAAAIKAVLERAGVEAGEVDEVILGQVLPAGEGQNRACAPLRSACSRSQPAMRRSSLPAAWSRCRWRRIARTCAAA